jgi:cell division protein FtsQ
MSRVNIPSQRVRPKRKPAPLWQRLPLPLILIGGGVIVLAGFGAYAWQTGWIAHKTESSTTALIETAAQHGLKVQEILLEGRQETDTAAIRKALGSRTGDPILDFSPAAAQAALEALPWVKSARVERRLPGTIYVRLEERTAFALWQQDKRIALVDQTGHVLADPVPTRFSRYPLLVGPNAPLHAGPILAALRNLPTLHPRFRAASWIGERRWNLTLQDGLTVYLPEDAPETALSQLADILDRPDMVPANIAIIDMRLPDRLIFRPSRDSLGEDPPAKAKPKK